jgi:hypothetical protein
MASAGFNESMPWSVTAAASSEEEGFASAALMITFFA